MHDRNLIWVTEKGEKFTLKDIKSNHLENIVKMLRRKGANGEYVKSFNQELRLRKLNNIENNINYRKVEEYDEGED